MDLPLPLLSSSFLLEPPLGTLFTTHGAPLLLSFGSLAEKAADVDADADADAEEVVDAAHAARTIILFAERFFIVVTGGSVIKRGH